MVDTIDIFAYFDYNERKEIKLFTALMGGVVMAETDYEELCKEIFGTTEEGRIRALAAEWKKRHTRNAGRKRALSTDDMDVIDTMRQEGATIPAIAKHFGLSRPVISQYLNERPSMDYTMRMDFRLGEKTCTVIYVDFGREKIAIQNRTNDMLHRAFGVKETPTWEDFESFLESRCFPKSRKYVKQIINGLGLMGGYDPLAIAEATGGRTAEDEMYLTFRTFPKEVHTNAAY